MGCYNLANITAGSYLGGIVGYLNSSSHIVGGCFNVGTITANSTSNIYEGGIIGRGEGDSPKILYCANSGTCKYKSTKTHQSVAGKSDGSGKTYGNTLSATNTAGIYSYFTSGNGAEYLKNGNVEKLDIYNFKTYSNQCVYYAFTGFSGSGYWANGYYYQELWRQLTPINLTDAGMIAGYHIKLFTEGDFVVEGSKNILIKFFWRYNTSIPS